MLHHEDLSSGADKAQTGALAAPPRDHSIHTYKTWFGKTNPKARAEAQ